MRKSDLKTTKEDGMKSLTTLKDLMLEQARELYSSEQMQLKELPRLQQRVSSKELKDAITHHVNTTREQLDRLKAVFTKLNESPLGEESECMDSLFEATWELVDRSSDPEVRDAGLITSIQHINHYEIAGYGTTTSFAKTLGLEEIAGLLHKTLEEEKLMDQQLTRIAEKAVNPKAKAPII